MPGLLTSDNAPIRVDFVPSSTHGGRGRLGMTFAPGKKDHYGLFGAWDRDLAMDLDRLRDAYGTQLLVSLVEDAELELLGIAGLVKSAMDRGIDIVRHPIPDGHAPELRAARELVSRVLEALAGERTVVVHCRGGLGRAGTIAAATLIASGLDAGNAIDTVRAARRGTIETAAQEAFLRSFTAR